jgi:hypothetical protein
MKGAFLFLSFVLCTRYAAAQVVIDTPNVMSRDEFLYNFYSQNSSDERIFGIGKSALLIEHNHEGFYTFTEIKRKVLTRGGGDKIKDGTYLKLDGATNEIVIQGFYRNDIKDGIWINHNPDSTITLETWKRGKLIETTLLKPKD